MMTKAKALFRHSLMQTLTNECTKDNEFLLHLLWAQEYVQETLDEFSEDEIDELYEAEVI